MKKLFIACAAAAVLMSSAAWAEGLPYLRTLPQYEYINTTLLTPESYPEVHILPAYVYALFNDYSKMDPIYCTFPGPAGASPESFSTRDASYIDEENTIQYLYQITESASFEEFINEAEDDAYILRDGSDGTAIRIDPDNEAAYGLMKTTQYGKSSKLYIKIILNALDSKMPLDTRVTALTDAIVAEVDRVASEMTYEEFDPLWSKGKYAGIKMLDYDFKNLVEFDFPTFSVNYSDGGTAEATVSATKLDGTSFEGVIDFGGGAYVEVELDYEAYSYPAYKEEEKDPEFFRTTLDSGHEWMVYVANRTSSDNTIFSWYASCPTGIQSEYSGEYYFNVHLTGNDISWLDEDDMLQDLAKFDTFRIVDPADDPYVPTETVSNDTTETKTDVQTDTGTSWTCECGEENTGNFCSNCGKPKPSAEWTCPDCGNVNKGNFCSNCGRAKP